MIHKTMRSILSVLLAALLLVTSIPLTPAFAGGGGVSPQSESAEGRALEPAADGTYLIYTAENLQEFADIVNGTDSISADSDADAKLMNNIDLNGSEENPWTPIGNEEHPYTGTFNGQNFKISGLYIYTGANNQGLFGYLSTSGDNKGTVQNLSVSGSVSGNNYVGGVVGYNGGTVENCHNIGEVSSPDSVIGSYVGGVVGYNGGRVKNCYNTGTVTGTDDSVGGVVGYNSSTVENCYNIGEVSGNQVGGVVGWNSSSGTVTNCYNTGAVSGGEDVGGVVGYNDGSGTNCYNTGTVSSNSSTSDVGGVVGYNISSVKNCYNTGAVSGSGLYVGGVVGLNSGTNASVTGCYFLKGTAEKGIGGGRAEGAESLTADEFKNQNSFTDWDFGIADTWTVHSVLGRPVLNENLEGGNGLPDSPYEISTADQLENFRDLVNRGGAGASAHAKLMNNIDLNPDMKIDEDGKVTNGKELDQWTPIGTSSSKPYSGNFDGNGKTISGLYIDNDADYQGLFGYVSGSGKVQNLSVSGSVKGNDYVGGVVGYNSGSVENCYNTGTVTGTYTYVGGVVGYNSGPVKNCYNTGNISGKISGEAYSNTSGGVVGVNDGSVENCYNTGAVNSSGDISGGVSGGVVGWNSGPVKNCYNTGAVNSSGNISGGVVGVNISSVTNCYNIGDVSGNTSGGVVGWNSVSVVGYNSGSVENCYNTGNVSGGISGGVVGQNISASVANCYYQTGKGAIVGIGGTTADDTTTVAKTAEQFASGEVAWRLQNGQTAGSSQVWGQSNLTATTSLPTLVALDKDENAKPVYKVAFISDNTEIEAEYANSGMTVTPPKAPEKTGHLFGGWYDNAELTGDPVTGTISVKGNATYTAKWEPYTYSISVDKSTLDFGSMTEGDTLPAAQTVTITNTGNQSVTVNLPTSTNYTITAGTGFTNGTATLAPDKTATFTVQPKDGLSRGSYSEQIAISNTNGEKAIVTATFTVKEPPYTGKYSYEVFTSVGDNGTLTVDRYATEGDKVTIDVTPDQAYKLDDLTVTANGKDVELTANSDGTYTFTMPSADVRITATFAKDPDWTEPEEPATDVSDLFIDIAPDAWYKDAVQYAYDNGLMTGVSATEFAPEQTTTRAMIVSILARLEGVTTAEAAGFADVNDNDWYATAVNWAASVGVVNGYEDNTFQPNTAITREQLAAILMNYAAYKGEDVSNRADLTSYTDQPSTWAQEAMQWAVAEGLISGVTADTLQPQGAATRAQVAAILQRFLSE